MKMAKNSKVATRSSLLDDFESEGEMEHLHDNTFDSEIDFESDVSLEEFELGSKTQSSKASKDHGKSKALLPVGTPESPGPYDVDSDEEKELLTNIKDEINDMVREEMHSELRVYKHKMEAIEEGRLPSSLDDAEPADNRYPDLANMSPQLRDAYIKMRKLDKILEKKLLREKEVKRDRILMERRMREEINNMETKGRDVQSNIEKYLSLALPPSHNHGVVIEEEEEEEAAISPVFQTQLEEESERSYAADTHDTDQPSTLQQESQRSSARSSRFSGTSNSSARGSSISASGRPRRKRDFIKRNKELAANAGDTVAMTDDEKKRLKELLTDIDALPEIPEEDSDISLAEENAFQLSLQPGEGFQPSDTDLRTLTSIDQHLQTILPEEEFKAITSSSVTHASERLFTRVGVRGGLDRELYGEKALMDAREEREFKEKLREIEEQLTSIQNRDTVQEDVSLTPQQLETLLEECVRSLSRVSNPPPSVPPDQPPSHRSQDSHHSSLTVVTNRSDLSARQQLMLNPPKLSPDTLQRLLSQAHCPLSSSLLALQDDDAKHALNGNNAETIQAETWKAIAEQPLDQGDGDHSVIPTGQAWTHTAVSGSPSHGSVSGNPASRGLSRCSELKGGEIHVSLPVISGSPLINTPQGPRPRSNTDRLLRASSELESTSGTDQRPKSEGLQKLNVDRLPRAEDLDSGVAKSDRLTPNAPPPSIALKSNSDVSKRSTSRTDPRPTQSKSQMQETSKNSRPTSSLDQVPSLDSSRSTTKSDQGPSLDSPRPLESASHPQSASSSDQSSMLRSDTLRSASNRSRHALSNSSGLSRSRSSRNSDGGRQSDVPFDADTPSSWVSFVDRASSVTPERGEATPSPLSFLPTPPPLSERSSLGKSDFSASNTS